MSLRYKPSHGAFVNPQRQQDRHFYNWLKNVKPSRLGLLWFFLVSILLHAGLLWHLRFISRHVPRPLIFSKIAIVAGEAETLPPAQATTQTPSPARTFAVPRDRNVASSGVKDPAASRSESSAGTGNTATGGEVSAGSGNVVTDDGGVGFAGSDSSGGAVKPLESGPGSGGSGPAKGKGQPAPARGAPSAAESSVIAIPPAIQRTTSPYESEVYAEADFYTLFTPDLRVSVNVPGNEVCLDGEILRTHEQKILTQRVTDISKCRYELQGDDQERMRCPPEAHTTIVTYDHYFSSPIKYIVNVCAAYDQSSCYINMRDDGPDQEVCRVRGNYEGIWAAGTMFHYPCMKSSSQSFSHPLQYEVRFVQNIEFPDARMRRRVLLREKRPVAPCR